MQHGVGLPVDAVSVDLQQDGDAVPGAADDLGRGHSGVQPQRHRRVPQVVGKPAERGVLLGGREGLLAGLVPDLVVAGVLQDAAPGGLEDPAPGAAAVVPGGTWPGTRRPAVPDGPDGRTAREKVMTWTTADLVHLRPPLGICVPSGGGDPRPAMASPVSPDR